MKKLLLILAMVACASPAFANVTANSGYWFAMEENNSCGFRISSSTMARLAGQTIRRANQIKDNEVTD